MKAIMYHYVRPKSKKYPNLRHLTFENFKKQIDFFEDKYIFPSKVSFIKMFSGENNDIQNQIILTFDDAFSDHYEYVYKELKKRGLWGFFFIPTAILNQEKVLDVHKIHYLLARNNNNEILRYLKTIIDDEMLKDKKVEEFRTLTYKNQENENTTLLIKRILNYYISYDWRKKIINKLMKKFCHKSEKEIHKKLYLSKDQIKKMYESGMVIGSHGINHLLMSKLSKKDQEIEIKKSFLDIEGILSETLKLKTYCYPYGGHYSYNDYTIKLLDKYKVSFSFSVEKRDITKSDFLDKKHELPRYDCNIFPHGKS